jgi:hypothetical protein
MLQASIANFGKEIIKREEHVDCLVHADYDGSASWMIAH